MSSGKIYKRLGTVFNLVHEILLKESVNKEGMLDYLNGVSNFASMLAMKRVQDSEISAIAGLLHGFYFNKTGIEDFPGPNSADAVRPILLSAEIFTTDELSIILKSIFYQEDTHLVHGPYEEIIKDAILFQMYFQNPGRSLSKIEISRLENVFNEFGISKEKIKANVNVNVQNFNIYTEDRRSKLADLAEKLARQNIIGTPRDQRYQEICRYWPDSDIYKVLEANWCAAFVYHCCMKVGMKLPIRYPNRMYRLAGVGAWLDWAQLAETGFFYRDMQEGFEPERGDIVIYEKLLTDNSHDHIGIVLACDGNQLLVAEGNTDNKNYSSVLDRERGYCILGYIRVSDSYQFNFQGEYRPT
ncbi:MULTISPECIES: CHAP domain-containing protein [unclassified Paenibacillus]|uniref:CHAP domain-containing protein n=1 Tax=unclassified Paenibacillus TaxID=185978 RepID=UPI000CFAD601|nr:MULTISPECIES: CHAP domain-containing protein [unclassified Paenibacillus]PRA08002.1 CHAP domain-containing protein [Paenibacillus sp. MYb63]PRA47920.1 CHAP domain-containing protein [Paenibacillus sp. MYb67]QZN74676.1 CHAP domain-containing protein [Paenibacillus sp. DR312]